MRGIKVRIQRVAAKGRSIDSRRLSRMTRDALAQARRKDNGSSSRSARTGSGLEGRIARAIAAKIGNKRRPHN